MKKAKAAGVETTQAVLVPDTAVLEALYDAYHRPGLGLAFALLGDRAAAEDVVEEVFLAAWRLVYLPDPARGTVRTWLLDMVRERSVAFVRAHPRLRPSVLAQATRRRHQPPWLVPTRGDHLPDELRQANQQLLLASLRQQELADEAETARGRLAFVLDASTKLAAARTEEEALGVLARLAVPYLADGCVADLVAEDGSLRPVAFVHRDAQRAHRLGRLRPDLQGLLSAAGAPRIVHLGAAETTDEDGALRNDTVRRDRDLLRSLDVASVMAVPLVVTPGRPSGVLAFVSDARHFGPADLALAEDLAHRCALMVDNLRLAGEVRLRERLDGVLLAARTARHIVNNQLAITVGYTEQLATDQALPPDARTLAGEACTGARAAAQALERLQRVTRLAEIDLGAPGGPVLSLDHSIA